MHYWRVNPGDYAWMTPDLPTCRDFLPADGKPLFDQTTANPDADAVVPVGGWALFAPEAYKAFVWANQRNYDSGKLALVMPDTLRVEVELLQQGYAQVLVGQRPAEVGERAMDMLMGEYAGRTAEWGSEALSAAWLEREVAFLLGWERDRLSPALL